MSLGLKKEMGEALQAEWVRGFKVKGPYFVDVYQREMKAIIDSAPGASGARRVLVLNKTEG